jgi:hypothetical protein
MDEDGDMFKDTTLKKPKSKKHRAKKNKKKFMSGEKVVTLDDNQKPKAERLAFPLDFKKDMFKLEFSSMLSDKSTSDNFVSDEDPS